MQTKAEKAAYMREWYRRTDPRCRDCGAAVSNPRAKRCKTCMGKATRGPNNATWKGGYISFNGYRRIHVDGRRISEHRYVWQQAHGPIPAGHLVHHKDENRLNNALENLVLMTTGEHTRHHLKHKTQRVCEQPDCDRPYHARGCCSMHHQRLHRRR